MTARFMPFVVLCLVLGQAAFGQLPGISLPEIQTEQKTESELPSPPAVETFAEPTPEAILDAAPDTDVEPDWFGAAGTTPCDLWEAQFDIIATTMHLRVGNFGVWTEDSTPAGRLTVSNEDCSGFGLRGQGWVVAEEFNGFPDVNAGTLYGDAYQRNRFDHFEFTYGGGAAVAHMEIGSAEFLGVGGSLFAEGFYRVWDYTRFDLGAVGRGRLALLATIEDDLISGSGATIDEFGWGLRMRRKLEHHEGLYWHVDLMRETQHWGSMSDFFASDQVFTGTALKFGIGW
jgi:hypothetical protein